MVLLIFTWLLAIGPQQHTPCADAFDRLYAASTTEANGSRYAQAAALRDGAARLYSSCLNNDQARYPLYPFGESYALLIASTFWHLAGFDSEARRDLSFAKTSIAAVQGNFAKSGRDANYWANLKKVQDMVTDRDSGRWGVWRFTE